MVSILILDKYTGQVSVTNWSSNEFIICITGPKVWMTIIIFAFSDSVNMIATLELLKVSKSWKQFLEFSILPKIAFQIYWPLAGTFFPATNLKKLQCECIHKNLKSQLLRILFTGTDNNKFRILFCELSFTKLERVMFVKLYSQKLFTM